MMRNFGSPHYVFHAHRLKKQLQLLWIRLASRCWLLNCLKKSKRTQRKLTREGTRHFLPDSVLFNDFQPFLVYSPSLFTDSRCFLFSSSLLPLHFVAKCSELKICCDLLEVDFVGQWPSDVTQKQRKILWHHWRIRSPKSFTIIRFSSPSSCAFVFLWFRPLRVEKTLYLQVV
jgi:hypothetical protein